MEIFQLVDKSGRPTGEAPRSACHGNPALIHLVVHLHLFDSRGRLFLQKRAAGKDTNPGLWDTSVGGHVVAGEEALHALLREAREELDIDASGAVFLYGLLWESPFESEYAQCFALVRDGEVRPDPSEIEEGRFHTVSQVDEMVAAGVLTPQFEREWPLLKARIGSLPIR
jgi:isopentenyldiphosphate isomerase